MEKILIPIVLIGGAYLTTVVDNRLGIRWEKSTLHKLMYMALGAAIWQLVKM